MALPPNYVPQKLGTGRSGALGTPDVPAMSGFPSRAPNTGTGAPAAAPNPAPRRLGMTPYENAQASANAIATGQNQRAFFGNTYSPDDRNSYIGQAAQNAYADPSAYFNTGVPGQRGGGVSGSPGDFDMRGPGAAEQFFANNLENYQAGPQGQTNYAGDAYQSFLQGSAPNLDPYYENAKRRASEDINQQFASRGAYGSSAALDQLAETATNLNAEQANREGDYALQRYGLGGQLGSTADAGMRASGADQLNWLNSGQGAAGEAQGARRTRSQDMFNNISNTYGGLAATAGHIYDSTISDDQSLLDAMLGMRTGTAAEGQNQAYRREDQSRQDINNAFTNAISAYNAVK